MNKQGALILHWTIFGILAAIGFFFILTIKTDLAGGVKGEWQIDFLKNNYLEAEKELLKTNIDARKIGLEIARELALKGGYIDTVSECGNLGDVPLWNKAKKDCFPDISETLQSLAIKKLKDETGKEFTEVGFAGILFMGQGEEKKVISEVGVYKYHDSFAANLGYSFDEYDILESEARAMLIKCIPAGNLASCLSFPDNWHIESCTSPGSISGRQIPFCVTSVEGIEYKFGLDFTTASN